MALTKVTGQVIKNTTDVTVGVLTVTNTLAIGGTVSIGGTLTYEDVTNIDSVGLITARNGIVVGSGITLSKDGDIFATGIVTATSFVGSGANLTGVASTENIRTNTNATFLQNVTVVGTSTVTGTIVPSSDSATDIGTTSVRFQNAYVDTYYGSGANLTGINADLVNDTSPQLGGELDTNGNDIRFADTDEAIFGNGADLKIYHEGGGGDNIIKNNIAGKHLKIQHNDGSAAATFYNNSSVELYHSGTKRIETTSGGVNVTGNVKADGIRLDDDDEIRIGTDDDLKLYHNNGNNYIGAFTNSAILISTNSTHRWTFNNTGEFKPSSNNTYDIGDTTHRVRNIYTNDLNLSNEGSSNDVDGTWGNYTIQEGESDLFLINNRSGKKYKFNLTEVS